jgi:hypothetical protein
LSDLSINDLVEKYIALRDKKAEIKKQYETKVAGVDELLDKIEVVLLKHFQETGSEGISTKAGTAYISSRTSATVADWDAFFKFVSEGSNWEFLERRCSKEAVVQFKAAQNDLPPGINWSETRTVNVRRK